MIKQCILFLILIGVIGTVLILILERGHSVNRTGFDDTLSRRNAIVDELHVLRMKAEQPSDMIASDVWKMLLSKNREKPGFMNDGWGNEFRLEFDVVNNDNVIVLTSRGVDQLFDTPDDVRSEVFWNKRPRATGDGGSETE